MPVLLTLSGEMPQDEDRLRAGDLVEVLIAGFVRRDKPDGPAWIKYDDRHKAHAILDSEGDLLPGHTIRLHIPTEPFDAWGVADREGRIWQPDVTDTGEPIWSRVGDMWLEKWGDLVRSYGPVTILYPAG